MAEETKKDKKKDKKKNKKAKFQTGDYSDIKIKGIIDPVKVEVKDAEMPKVYQDPKIKYNEGPKPPRDPKIKYKSMELPKTKKYITVPRDSKNIPKFKSGGRAGYKGGGMSQRGLGRAFMKGGKV